MQSSQIDFYGKINKSIQDTSNVFILGSSRAESHYDSQVLQKYYGRSVFNAGAGGYGVFYSYAVLKERLKLHKPGIVILDIAPTILNDKKQFGLLSKLQPLADIYPAFDEIITLNPDYRPMAMFFETYKYNSTLFESLHGVIKKEGKGDAFSPLEGKMNKNTIVLYHDPNSLSAEQKIMAKNVLIKQLLYIDKIDELCKKDNVKLYFVTSPAYVDLDRNNIIKAPIVAHFSKRGYDLINFMNDSRFAGHLELFKDQQHLNGLGAGNFTRAFADTLIVLNKTKAVVK